MTEIEDFIRRLPKAELHLHLEGTILPATLVELSARHDARPLTLAEAEALYRFTDFTGFMDAFKAVTGQLIGPEDYELAAWRMMEHLAEQGVVHAEVYISVGVIYHWRNHDPAAFDPIFAGLERARERAERELGLSLYWIFDAVRHFTVPEAERVFRKAAELKPAHPSIIGIGLGGDERRTGSEPFRTLYTEATRRASGSPTTPAKPQAPKPSGRLSPSVPSASATPSRLCNDPSLLQELKAREVPLELSPTSNRPHRRLPLNRRTPAAPPLRCRPARHTQLRRPGLLRLRPGQRIPAGPHRAQISPATNSASSPATPSERASFPRRQKPHGSLASIPSSKQSPARSCCLKAPKRTDGRHIQFQPVPRYDVLVGVV